MRSPFVPFLFFLSLVGLVYHWPGQPNHWIGGMLLFAVLFFIHRYCRRENGSGNLSLSQPSISIVLSCTFLLFSILLRNRVGLLYVSRPLAYEWVQHLTFVIILLAVGLLALFLRTPRAGERAVGFFFLSVIGLGIISRILVLVASPNPHIDVFTIAQEAAQTFLAGSNPYARTYPDIYAGLYDYVPHFNYLPGVLYPITIAKFLTGDIRYAHLVGDLLSLGGIFLVGTRLGLSRVNALLLSLVWFVFPITYYVLEQAWTDLLLIPICLYCLAFLFRGQAYRASLLAGVAMGTKQYAIVFVFFVFLHLFKSMAFRVWLKCMVIGLMSFLVLVGPFMLSAPKAFLHSNVFVFTAMAPRSDGITIWAYLDKLGIEWNVSLGLIISIAVSAALSLWLLLKKQVWFSDMLFAIITSYLFCFIFAKLAFVNYYFFTALFALIYFFANQESKPLSANGA